MSCSGDVHYREQKHPVSLETIDIENEKPNEREWKRSILRTMN
jgi:hypothetical protein